MRAQQVTALLLCALLSSTLAHDYLRAKYLSPKERSSKLISPFEERAGSSDDVCVWVCNGTTPTTEDSLRLFINSTANLVGIVNITAKVAIIIDVTANIVGLLNGTSGDAIFINLITQTVLYIRGNETSATWHSSNGCFKSFFYSLTTLTVFFELNVGTTFTVKTISREILQVIASLVATLSVSLSIKIQQNLSFALEILISISTTIVKLLSGSLKGLLTFAGEAVVIHLAGDLQWFVSVLEGLEVVFGAITGGLAALIKAKVQFDLAVLFAATNGLELLINLLLAIVARVNLSQLGSLLGSIDKLLAVIVKLGGNVLTGVTGVLYVVWYLLLFINGTIKLEQFLEVLVKFSANRGGSKTEIDLSIYIEGLLQVIFMQNSTHGSCSNITALNGILVRIQNGTFVFKGVNISSVIKLLLGTVSNALELVVQVLLLIVGVVSFVTSITTLVLYLIRLLLTIDGVALLKLLIPSLSISIKVGSNGNLLQSILKSLNLTTLLGLITGGIWGLLNALPVIKQIIAALSAAITASCNGKYSLKSILTSTSSIITKLVAEIKSLIRVTIYGTGSVSSTGSTAAATATTKSSSWAWTWRWVG